MGAKLQKGTQRQDDGIEGCCIQGRHRQPELMCNAIDLPDAMPTVGRAAKIELVEVGERNSGFRFTVMLDRRQHHRLRL